MLSSVAGRCKGTEGFDTLFKTLTVGPGEPLKNFKAEAEESLSQLWTLQN